MAKWKLGMGWISDSDIAEIPNYTTTVEDLICSVVLDVILQKTNESEMNDAFVKSGMKEDGINIIPRKLLAKIAVIPKEYDQTFVSKILDDLSDINYHKAVKYLRPIFDKFSKPMEENRNILMEQIDHFLGGDLMEEETKSFTRLVPLAKNMETDVLRARQNDESIPDEDFVNFVKKKFDKASIESISTTDSAIKSRKINMYSKKKRDLGSDHWEITLVANKYLIVAFQGSSDTSVSKREYYEVK